jgi:hypothetical protein
MMGEDDEEEIIEKPNPKKKDLLAEDIKKAKMRAENTPDFASDEIEDEEEKQAENTAPEAPMMTPEERWEDLKNKTPGERKTFIKEHAKKLSPEDYVYTFPNGEKGNLDFAGIQDAGQLIERLMELPYIENQLGEKIPTDTLINIIYDRMLNRENESKDWTKITLKHGLREAVYRVNEDYMQGLEYKNLAGLDFSGVQSVEDLKAELRRYGAQPNKFGQQIPADLIIQNIEKENYKDVPSPIAHKLAEILKREQAQGGASRAPQKKKGFGGFISKAKSWFSRK